MLYVRSLRQFKFNIKGKQYKNLTEEFQNSSLQIYKYIFYEHQISAGQLSADSSTETLYCLISAQSLSVVHECDVFRVFPQFWKKV